MRSADSPFPVDSSLNSESGPSASQAVPHSHTTQLPHFVSSGDSVRAQSPLLANTFFRPQKVLPPGSPPSPLPHLGSLAGTSMCKQSVINGTCTHSQPKQGPGLVHLPAQGPAEPAGAYNACAQQDRTSRTRELRGSVCFGRTRDQAVHSPADGVVLAPPRENSGLCSGNDDGATAGLAHTHRAPCGAGLTEEAARAGRRGPGRAAGESKQGQ